MTGKHVEDEIVGSTSPCSFGNNTSSFDDALVEREDEEQPWDVLKKNKKSNCVVGMIHS